MRNNVFFCVRYEFEKVDMDHTENKWEVSAFLNGEKIEKLSPNVDYILTITTKNHESNVTARPDAHVLPCTGEMHLIAPPNYESLFSDS